MVIVCSLWKESETEFAGSTRCFKKQVLKLAVLRQPVETNKYLQIPLSFILLIVAGK